MNDMNNLNQTSPAHRRPGRRAAVVAGLVLTVGLGVSTQVPAQASAHAPAHAPAQVTTAAQQPVSGTSGQAVTRVADFYGAYVDAKGDYTDPDGTLATGLRQHYLAPAFATRLAAWEEENGADGILRAQNVPARWTVSDNGTVGNGHEVIVTLTFGSGGTMQKTKLFVLLERYNHIVDINTASTR
ncbi:hypothetical protein [Streptomyces sp. H39-S7]|uniref:hypothetical protein n=1 Tax=Streptomyces sp. H39-S7 TaxID=3004357 RepID=UPI0022AF8104|nr:hypothetical protein [Streptomyces sp. H39-S7]MCZ4125534.1 hypothetical protein [Streptomyces sp. H39-S7]